MSHLSHDELLEAAERGGDRHREHLAACSSCRGEVDALAAVLREAALVEVPEPSPLFWEHFSARVREQCDEERADRRSGAGVLEAGDALAKAGGRRSMAWSRWRLATPALAGLALIVVMWTARFLAPDTEPVTPRRATAVAGVPAAPAAADDSTADDESWSVFAELAEEAEPAGSEFETPAPGVADGAVLHMTDDERGELIRLLEDELGRAVRTEG